MYISVVSTVCGYPAIYSLIFYLLGNKREILSVFSDPGPREITSRTLSTLYQGREPDAQYLLWTTGESRSHSIYSVPRERACRTISTLYHGREPVALYLLRTTGYSLSHYIYYGPRERACRTISTTYYERKPVALYILETLGHSLPHDTYSVQ